MLLKSFIASAGLISSAARTFATQPLQDYSLALRKAAEVGSVDYEAPVKGEIGLCAGAPPETFKRPARIYVSSRSSSQQGFGKTLHDSSHGPQWKIAFDTTGKWENQLMGWTSTADPLENIGRATLFFYTKEEAMAFCNKNGWEYTVDMPNERKTTRSKRYNTYGDNFSVKRKGFPDNSYLASRSNY
jgi:NADH dehydrogenase (ubiquinone) Fe-S protein 4